MNPQSGANHITRLIKNPDNTETLQIKKAHLKVVKGPDKGRQVQISSGAITVGTAEDCDLVLSDAGISRRHFEIGLRPNGFALRDLGSKNGTLVGGILVRDATLTGKEEIRCGNSHLRLILSKEHEDHLLSSRTSFGRLLGRSKAMREVFAVLERTAGSDTTLLLEGESGTGKDLAAESLHQHSPRREGPFIVVDCGAINPTLAESELFGHRKGSFTGANQDHPGVFEAAHGGTVFIDEIGELELQLQTKLLRLLEKRQIRRVGENHYRDVDVRLIAATNRDLGKEKEQGRFREDLFYRLSVVRIRMPSLRERPEDIGLLARAFVANLRPDLDPIKVISERVLAMLSNHDWPGNVRELRNVIERLLLFPEKADRLFSPKESSVLTTGPELLGLPYADARRQVMEQFDRFYLSAQLEAAEGVVADAAKRAGMPRQSFYRLMSKHRLVRK